MKTPEGEGVSFRQSGFPVAVAESAPGRDGNFLKDFETYLDAERNYSPNTIRAYRKDISVFLNYARDKKIDITVLERRQIRSFITRVRGGLSAVSIGRMLSSIRSFFRFLIIEGIMEENPFYGVSVPGKIKKIPTVLEENEMNILLSSAWFHDT